MERTPPGPLPDEIALYTRTYYSLLRSSDEVRVRAFEEAHAFSNSSLHPGALLEEPDLSAFAYAAARLPKEMPHVDLIILGQSHELFEAAGYSVQEWQITKTRGRRRPLRFDGKDQLAVFIASASDIDDLVPILTAYQIEWNKLHERAKRSPVFNAKALAGDLEALAEFFGVHVTEIDKLELAFGRGCLEENLNALRNHPLDLRVRMLAASYSQYQRAAQRWWSAVEASYLRQEHPRRPPIYFVSSNTHAIANLVGGYARAHMSEIGAWAKDTNPEGLGEVVESAISRGDQREISSLIYYLLRAYIHDSPAPSGQRMNEVRAFERQQGLVHLSGPGRFDVDAQIVELSKLKVEHLDPDLRVPGIEKLVQSDAVLLNIDYPLGMAAYHLLSRVGQGVGDLRGVYVMGKAATLNGRVGDVMLSNTVYDEHSHNTFLFRNALAASAVKPYLKHGSVFDNQAAVTVLSAFLQNKNYMNSLYRRGYTVLEMEAGPFLSAIYELSSPRKVPADEIVNTSAHTPFDVGIVHYASDTPYSRRQSLLSKSLSYFGVDSTYACATAIVRRIFEQEIERVG